MTTESVPQSSPSGPNGGNDRPHHPKRVWLTNEEWGEISNCASALFAALECYEHRPDEAWELVVSVQQRFQRALSPINERLSDLLNGKQH